MHERTPSTAAAAVTNIQPRKRGRPTISHDNRKAQELLNHFTCLYEMVPLFPWIEDIFTGAVNLQSEGQGSTRPLSKFQLFRVLSLCETISTPAAAEAIQCNPENRTAYRYAAIARVASKAIQRHLAQHPEYLSEAKGLKRDRADMDAPYLLELAAMGIA